MKYLPATILSKTPFVIGCFFEDFIKFIDSFQKSLDFESKSRKNIYAVFMFGYHYETAARMEYALGQVEIIKERFPYLKMYFMGNSELERDNFREIGCNAIYCSQNAFLDEKRYFVLNSKKIYDAVYLARITPIKRHNLVLKIKKLFMIGDYFKSEAKYAEGILANLMPDTVWKRRVKGLFVFYYLNKAKVGLCLSPEEGAMYSCAEYGLCGLPVLTTQALGGREFSLSAKYVKIIQMNPTAEEVAEAVEVLASQKVDSREIRKATIDVLKEHRQRYFDMCDEIFNDAKEGSVCDLKKMKRYPHKLGVRCPTLPMFKYFNSLRQR